MLKQVKDLLSFKAFKPSKLDVKVPLGERFLGEGSIMGISISNNFLKLAEIEYETNSAISLRNIKSCLVSTEEEKINSITAFAKDYKLSYAVLLGSPGIQVIKLEKALPKKGIDRLYDVKYHVSDILGEQAEEGRAYAYVFNSKFPESLVFSYDQVTLDYYVNLVNMAGLEVVRASCSIYATLDYLINEDEKFLTHSQIVLIYSNDSLIIGSICDGKFQQIGFRSNIDAEDSKCHILRMIERFDYKHSQISYINCSDWDIEMYFKQHYSDLKIEPIFQDSFAGILQLVCYG